MLRDPVDPGDKRARAYGGDRTRLLAALDALLRAVAAKERARRRSIRIALPQHRGSAANLAHYLALRSRDLHALQFSLAAAGLSSLGRSEGHVRDSLFRIRAWLSGKPPGREPLDLLAAEALLRRNSQALFGPLPADRRVYIMLTAPVAAEATPAWADEVLQAGVDVLRINAAHESPREWLAITRLFRRRAAALGKRVRVLVDLPGPKMRAEIRQFEQGVLHLPRRKDRLGRTLGPTSLTLVAAYSGGTQLPVPAQWLAALRRGDTLELKDAGGRQRRLAVVDADTHGVHAQCSRSLYLTGGLVVRWRRRGSLIGLGRVGAFPRQPRELRLSAGQRFLINASGRCDDASTAVLALAEPRMLSQVRPGERVVLDDGRITAVVERRVPGGLECRVQLAARPQARVASGKGVAFPDSALSAGRLGTEDEVALGFALAHADAVGASFVSSAADVALVGRRVRRAARRGIGLVLKLETRGAIERLPEILFEALRHDPVGLMIARGDLAVSLSFERLAEMQEELLWFGEACHLPVVWATQVLDSVAHSGIPTRAEVTDAAMAARAECVMLNRGPHAAKAVRMLADIILKMQAHQSKKRAMYRPLRIAGRRSRGRAR